MILHGAGQTGVSQQHTYAHKLSYMSPLLHRPRRLKRCLVFCAGKTHSVLMDRHRPRVDPIHVGKQAPIVKIEDAQYM